MNTDAIAIAPSGNEWVILPAPCGKAWKIHCQSCPYNFKDKGMPPMSLSGRPGFSFALGASLGKARPSVKLMGGITQSKYFTDKFPFLFL